MTNDRSDFVLESFNDIEKDMLHALNQQDEESIQYNFLRLFRLLKKIEEFIYTFAQKSEARHIEEFLQIRVKIETRISEWKATLAYKSESDGNIEYAEKLWFDALSFDPKADDYIQYAHAILRNKNLYVNKDIVENMAFVTNFTVRDIKISLKRARMSVKSAVSELGITESTGYFLAWLDLMDKAIDERDDLVQALTVSKEEITIDETLAELHQLIGMATVKRKIKEISDWVTFTQMRRDEGLKVDEISLHMVFSGNPGTGKTTVARIVAKIFKALGVLKKGHLVEVGRSDLVAEYVGQTAVKTMKKIKEAEHGVLFIDEAYSLTRSGGNDFGIEAVDTLVKAMEDNRKNLVVILAGYPDEMKEFIRANPGLYSRFKYHIQFPDYSIEELLMIHDLLLLDKQYKITDEARIIVQRMIEKIVHEQPKQHGNGRFVRNLIEDEILNKASLVVENFTNGHQPIELDIIDETVAKMVEEGMKTDQERYTQLLKSATTYHR
ncbi:AAA family ATPase [Litchfieldia alkalitelluris]|uniref:AAA family ATPase n=1 Tax=Litchfieldia alkalitelluris TaxID=304268 RepID=UPI0011162673|nr:AAA family ATPase [Litchfieldia alkalitelluris]